MGISAARSCLPLATLAVAVSALSACAAGGVGGVGSVESEASRQSEGREPKFCEPGTYNHHRHGEHVRLKVWRHRVQRGATNYFRVENLGTRTLGFGWEYHVERFAAGTWKQVPESSSTAWPDEEIGLSPGQYGWCGSYEVPKHAPLGRYRFTKAFRRDGGGERTLFARFRVVR